MGEFAKRPHNPSRPDLPDPLAAPSEVCVCGQPLAKDAAYCSNCGRSVRPLCGVCNAPFAGTAQFCATCGAPKSFTRPTQCPNCTIRLMGAGNFCPGCGQLLYKLCGTCGTRQMSGWLHCPVCNRPAETQEPPQGMDGELAPTAIPAVGGDAPVALAEILNQEGASAFERDQFEDAEQLFRRATELDPEEPLYLTNLAAVLGELDREDEARLALQRALQLDPDDPGTLLAAGVFADERGQEQEAISHWKRLINVAPDSEEAEEARQNLQERGAL